MNFDDRITSVIVTIITTLGALLTAYIVNRRFKKTKPKEIQYIDIAFTQLESYAKNIYKDNQDLRLEIIKKDDIIDRQKVEIDNLRVQADTRNSNPTVEIDNVKETQS